jgi:hypothetical protein
MSDTEIKQSEFTGWAIVEMMGHRHETGYVTTEHFGQAALFRVDTPEMPEREFILERPGYANHEGVEKWCPIGTKVKRRAIPGRSCLVAPGSLYAINPCTEEAARRAIERGLSRPLIALELPPEPQTRTLPAPDTDDDD